MAEKVNISIIEDAATRSKNGHRQTKRFIQGNQAYKLTKIPGEGALWRALAKAFSLVNNPTPSG